MGPYMHPDRTRILGPNPDRNPKTYGEESIKKENLPDAGIPDDDDDREPTDIDIRRSERKDRRPHSPYIPRHGVGQDTRGKLKDKIGLGYQPDQESVHRKTYVFRQMRRRLGQLHNYFNALPSMCEITEEEKLKFVPAMLSEDDMNFYAKK